MGSTILLTLPRSDGEPSDAGISRVHTVVFADLQWMAACDHPGRTGLNPTLEWSGVQLVDHALDL